jgi:hypothetical protein
MDQNDAAWEARTEAAPGLTIAEARIWFEKVQNPAGWKLPIDSILVGISPEDRIKVGAAVIFYTGSVAHWTRIEGETWRVQAAGYYEAVGA